MRGCVRLLATGTCVWLVSGLALVSAASPPAAPAVPGRAPRVGVPEAVSAGITETLDEMIARGDSSRAAAESPLLPETIGANFKAIGFSESGFLPPDIGADVGPTQVLVHTNGRVRVFAKTGASGTLSLPAINFWGSVANGAQPLYPQVRYDRFSGRWILVTVNATKPNNRVMIAVQTSPGTVTGASSFTFYQFNQGNGGGSGDTGNVCDSPRLGIDNNALYIGCNMLTTTGALDRITLYVVRKSSIIPPPGTLVVTAFRDVSNGTAGPGPFAPVGVDNTEDPLAASGYFIGVDIASPGLLQLMRVGDPGGAPTLSASIPLAVAASVRPAPQPASGSSVLIDSGDDRLSRASIHKNKLTGAVSLWTSHANEVDAGCAANADGGRNGARWYEISGSAPTVGDPLAGTPTVVQAGALCDPAPSDPRGYIYPSVVETGQGHMVIGSSVAASSLFAGAASAGRLRFDPPGVTQPASTLQSGLAPYTYVTNGKNRWGSYSFTGVDPNDDQTAWTFQEYADATVNTWAVRAVQLRAPPPPALTGVQQTVCAGISAATVTLTGTSDAPAAGSEFFDPGPDPGGPGYSSHLSATASGGVTVNGAPALVLPASPGGQPVLKVTLSLNTTAAAPGLKTITIRNPDGQATIGTGVLRVDQPDPPPAANNGPICVGATLQLSVPTVPGATYAWTGPDGFSSSLQNPTIPAATFAAAGVYTVSFSGTSCALVPVSTTVQVLPDGAACEDGNACTTAETCGAGVCWPGASVVCNDGNNCTDDTCNPATGCVFTDITAIACNDNNVCTSDLCNPAGGCYHLIAAGVCDDGNACTINDICLGGTCQSGGARDCSDGNVCTNDLCDPATGCFHTSNTARCNDGNACTANDRCAGGACQPGTPVVCNDSNVCTTDTCNPATGCVFTDISASCDDANACTNDSCDPAAGCLHTNNAAACSDGDACTSGDTCGGAVCHPGPATNCDDHNVCTDDTCNPAVGCVHTPNALACDDGSVCTTGDACVGGSCVGAPIVCNDGSACTADSCDPVSGCVFTDISASCDDGNVCTADSCDVSVGCVHTVVSGACSDGNACTTGDTCQAGQCQPGLATVCDDGNVCTLDTCNPASGCLFTDITSACDDGNVCTDDGCDPVAGCFYSNNASPCDDGSVCTTADTCLDGVCQGTDEVICNDFNMCTSDHCDPIAGCTFTDIGAYTCNDLNDCTLDLCDPVTGCSYVVTGEGGPCDDLNACTTGGTCVSGVCIPDGPVVCDDHNNCTENHCNVVSGCYYTDITAIACDDNNVCTEDLCNPAGGCYHLIAPGPCDDGNACTVNDVCLGGTCQGGGVTDCNDGNVCTNDLCDPSTGCFHSNNVARCNDGNACTANDRCAGGVCQPGTAVTCNDGNLCTTDACNPASGCVFTDSSAACNDNNVCTNDTCDPAAGCLHTNNSAACSDGNACTSGDVCNGGVCQPGSAVACDDNNVCTADSCSPATGCVFTNVTAALCNDGNVCTNDLCDPLLGCFHTDNTAPCDDGDFCTAGDTCSAGSCRPGEPSVPPEVHGVSAAGHAPTTLSWSGLPGNARYDVAAATLSGLHASGTSGAACLADDVIGPSVVDPQAGPAPGEGYYYLVRVQGACGSGSYGSDSTGTDRVPLAACP